MSTNSPTTDGPLDGMVQAGQVRLHYLRWGDGSGASTLVCLHGSGGNARHWGLLARHLSGMGVDVVGFDHRGHGDSDKPDSGYRVEDFVADVEGAVTSLGLGRFDLLGASLGSRVALTYAAAHPDVVTNLVLVDLSFEMPIEAQQRMMNGHRTRPQRFDSLADVIEWSRSNPSRSRWAPELHEELGPYEVRQDTDGSWVWKYKPEAAIEAIGDARRDMWPLAESLAMPTLLVRGGNSPVLTPESARRMVERIPSCRLVEVGGAGHGVPRDNPEGFNRAVADFLVQQ